MMFDDIPLDGVNPETIDKVAKSGGLIPAGKYHVALDGAADVTAKQTGNPGTELTFRLLTGPFAGETVKETLWNTDKTQNRVILFGHRLGLLKSDGKKYSRVEGKSSFQDVLGAECVVEVAHREYKKADGTSGKAANLTFGGIWALDDKDVKDVPKAKAGTKPAVTPPKKIDTSGI
ncbi:hypothetical protein [Frigoriglobus tundricola]|uniref:DUF669 domain-containing protein n=1 Tax=Frigoriglobus tundricola TaxID=2774151 RepID=A0A6M5YL43_9BACT|nr:hypothetical protein [Frigoriglobus tundricola]QJW94737.1 hypothetical protein FTUN_2259 [Frigoriglobus tundricola]